MNYLNDIILDSSFKMAGSNLVEASAGTGKTYCIQTLFLRLVIVQGVEVGNILVVTFTDAATKELRDRLRSILQKFQQYCDGHMEADDGDYDRVRSIYELELAGNIHKEGFAAERDYRVRCALLDFDEASISTIHGFCSKVLSRYAFECGHDFDAELSGNTDSIVSDLCEDWWRRNTYNVSFIDQAFVKGLSLANVKNAVKQYIKKPDSILRPDADGFEDAVFVMRDRLNKVAEWWLINGSDMKTELLASRDSGFLNDDYVITYPSQLDVLCKYDKRNIEELMRLLTCYKKSSIINTTINVDGKTPTGKQKTKRWSPGKRTKEFMEYAEELSKLCDLQSTLKLQEAMLSIKEYYQENRKAMHVMSYDDLLLTFRDALRNDETGGILVKALRDEYQVALIDEFQDTDPVQYEIFKSIFINVGMPIFLVGDPKQAIYKFRNGDIFTYYAAQKEVASAQHYTLSCNYRSETNLIKGLNTIFGDTENHIAFLNKNISYIDGLTAKGKKTDESLLLDGKEDASPFRIWYYRGVGDSTKGGEQSPFRRRVYSDVADEIVSLLQNDKVTIGGRKLKPSDFAVLVLRHTEAAAINSELSVRNVPSVRQSIGNVFDSVEASDMYLLLNAIVNPSDISAILAVLATDLSAYTNNEIYGLKSGELINSKTQYGSDMDGHVIEDIIKYFLESHELWVKGSFIEAFSYISEKLGVKGCLMSHSNGERRVTNLLQIEELIHDAVLQKSMGMQMTIHWFLAQLDEDTREVTDAQEMRLESDSDAVHIMTVFKSKGLEFPVVFAPTLWKNKKAFSGMAIEYHEESNSDNVPKLILDLDKNNEGKAIAAREQEEEDVRLLYVASTRAIHRTYLVWGDMDARYHNSAVKHVLSDGKLDLDKCVVAAAKEYGNKDFDIDRGEVNIAVRNMGDEQHVNIYTELGAVVDTELLKTADSNYAAELYIDKTHGHTSFSGIAPEHAVVQADKATEDIIVDAEYTLYEHINDIEEADSINIFNFVAGAKTGTCWHSIFEVLDFKASDTEIRRVVNAALDAFRLNKGATEEIVKRKQDVVYKMVKGVLEIKLPCSCRLSDISVEKKLAEMEFNFSLPLWNTTVKNAALHGRRTTEITAVLHRYWGNDTTKQEFLNQIRHWDKQIPQGFMTGFIDLLFEYDGKYYIIDWKSNRCGGSPDGFSKEGLCSEMAGSSYFLQYLIYTVALHNYLAGCIDDYDYDKYFGGAIYIFLRGYGVAPENGVYFDRPSRELVEDLSDVLGDFR